ncbi:Uncharacterised protein [Citrobacter koseri]|uniref:Uncharacterized protein n=1 Tax=Citrobacter koseri TaxID=545 RepID=A0A3S4J4I1_CITKO|nr:Uncharacterised protein [Citrobacter koseri]
MNRRQRRRHVARQFNIIIANHRHILRDAQPYLIKRLIRTDCHCIIAGKYRLWALFMGQQHLHGFKSAAKLEISCDLIPFRNFQPRAFHGFPIPFQPQTRGRFVQWAGNAGYSGKTFINQVLRR